MNGHPDVRTVRSEHERRESLRHLAGCAECRAVLAGDDPSALFSLLALRDPADDALEGVSRAVEVRVAVERRGALEALRERGLPRPLPVAIAAAAAAFFLVAGWVGSPRESSFPEEFAAARVDLADVRVTETDGPARVVDLTVGNTRFVMIFAPEIDL